MLRATNILRERIAAAAAASSSSFSYDQYCCKIIHNYIYKSVVRQKEGKKKQVLRNELIQINKTEKLLD